MSERFRDVAPAMYRNGYEVLPIKLGEKHPAVDCWESIELTKEQLGQWYKNGVAQGGAGIRLGNGVIALDIDIDDAEASRIVQDCAELVLGPGPVRIGRAPRCAVLYKGAGLRKRVLKLIDPSGALHKVELLGKGQQVVAYGIHPDTGLAYEWVGDSPVDIAADDLEQIDVDAVADLFEVIGGALPEGWRVERVGRGAVVDEDDLISYIDNNPNPLDLTDGEVEQAIDLYDVPQDYDGWFRFLVACYHQSGGLEKGREWAHRGCNKLPNYNAKEIDQKWHSGTLKATGDRKPVTFASVMAEVKDKLREVAVSQSIDMVDKIKSKIQSAGEKELRTEIAQKIRKANLDDLDREMVAKTMHSRLKELSGVSFPIATVRKMLKPSGGDGHGECADAPEWCKDWIYVNSHDQLYCLDNRQLYKPGGFNIICGQNVPTNENGTKPTAVKWVSDNGFIDDVDVMAYMPGVGDVVCTLPNGARAVNSFDHRSIPHAAEKISEDGWKAIEVIQRHLKVLCGNDENRIILEQWLAHQVKFPGVKILWAPLIQSIQGVGKSFIGELLRSALGDDNVGVVSPNQVISDNNGWASGVCVNVLEELKISGHNRHEAANALKPLITDRYIQVQDKWVKAHKTINTSNYICFTNHKDSVPVEDDDRRWWIVFCMVQSLDEIGKPFGLSRFEYFEQLWSAIRNHRQCIRRWLLDYEISDEFNKLTKAPDSIYKDSMIATERASVEFLDELSELIKEGGPNYNKDVICSADLFAAAEFEIDGFMAATSKRSYLLKKLGYTQMPYQLKINGRMKRIWARSVVDRTQARELLHPVPF